MTDMMVGVEAPRLTLPRVGGGTMALVTVPGKQLLWFSRGFGCPFCRRSMAQLSIASDQFRAAGVEVLQIAPNLLEAAERYYGNTAPFFPMLCDPALDSYRAYGLQDAGIGEAMQNSARSWTTGWTTGEVVETLRANSYDVINTHFVERLLYHAGSAYEQGLFYVVDGLIVHHWPIKSTAPLPSNREILDEVMRG